MKLSMPDYGCEMQEKIYNCLRQSSSCPIFGACAGIVHAGYDSNRSRARNPSPIPLEIGLDEPDGLD